MELDNPKIEAAREVLFKDLVDDDAYMAITGWSPRTLARHIAAGKPYFKVGSKRMHHIPTDHEYLLTKKRTTLPRRPGRPRKGGPARPPDRAA